MKDKICETIGKRLRRCRNSEHMTQEQVAAVLGVTQDYYSKLENDKLVLSYDILEKLYHIGWDVDYIITGHGLEKAETLLQKKPILDMEICENQNSLRFWLYFMESQINKGVLSSDDYLYHETMAFMKINDLDMPNCLYAIRTTHHIWSYVKI